MVDAVVKVGEFDAFDVSTGSTRAQAEIRANSKSLFGGVSSSA
jgi:hypothetical protein